MAKYFVFVVTTLFTALAFSSEPEEGAHEKLAFPEELSERNGVFTVKGVPFTGKLLNPETFEQIGYFQDGKRHGHFIIYNEEGTLIRTTDFSDGVLHGYERQYHTNGALRGEARFEKGVILDNEVKIYDENGELIGVTVFQNNAISDRFTIVDGERLRVIDEKHPDGKTPKVSGTEKNGVREGKWITWHPNGAKESEGVYRDGQKQGEWKTWFDFGDLQRHVEYSNDAVVTEHLNITSDPRRWVKNLVTSDSMIYRCIGLEYGSTNYILVEKHFPDFMKAPNISELIMNSLPYRFERVTDDKAVAREEVSHRIVVREPKESTEYLRNGLSVGAVIVVRYPPGYVLDYSCRIDVENLLSGKTSKHHLKSSTVPPRPSRNEISQAYVAYNRREILSQQVTLLYTLFPMKLSIELNDQDKKARRRELHIHLPPGVVMRDGFTFDLVDINSSRDKYARVRVREIQSNVALGRLSRKQAEEIEAAIERGATIAAVSVYGQ